MTRNFIIALEASTKYYQQRTQRYFLVADDWLLLVLGEVQSGE